MGNLIGSVVIKYTDKKTLLQENLTTFFILIQTQWLFFYL